MSYSSLGASGLLLAATLLLSGCDGEARRLADAQSSYAAGRYESVVQALEGGAASPAASALFGAAKEALERRQAGLNEVERILALAPAAPLAELERQLLQGPGRIDDAEVAEAIAYARSSLADEYAEARARGMRWDQALEAGEAARAEAAAVAPRATALLGLAEDSRATKRRTVPAPAGAPEADFAPEQRLDTAWQADADVGSSPGVAAEPEGAAGTHSTEPADDWRTALARLEDGPALLDWAYEREALGALDQARAALLRAVGKEPEPEGRAVLERELRRIDQRQLLRQEVSAAILTEREEFGTLGVLGVEEEGVRFDGVKGFVRWPTLAPEDWEALGGESALTPEARLGLAMELLAASREDEGDRVLARVLRKGLVNQAQVDQVIAWHRGETPPPDGYAFEDERWVPALSVQADEDEVRAQTLALRFPRLRGAERDEAFDELFALGRRDLCRSGLEARWVAAAESYRKLRGRKALEGLAEARHEVDSLREVLLARIEDAFEYPADTPDQEARRRKHDSQEFIDRTTRELRDVFRGARPVTVRAATRDLLEEIRWLDDCEHELSMPRSWRPAEMPPWLLTLDVSKKSLTLEAFGWDRRETASLARDRAVVLRNAALLEADERELEESRTSKEEIRQVLVTNEYRVLLGRRALAWNPLLQAAAHDHSDYMSRTGDFGHTETTPGRETPFDRMRGRGYPRGGGENCYAGGSSADAAHQAWLHSPGHHRNIIAAGHTEMASSLQSRYWTQVFGSDTAFLEELEAWSD